MIGWSSVSGVFDGDEKKSVTALLSPLIISIFISRPPSRKPHPSLVSHSYPCSILNLLDVDLNAPQMRPDRLLLQPSEKC
jgi:hypothetical protein